MSLIDALRPRPKLPYEGRIDPVTKSRLDRGREPRDQSKPKRKQCQAFFEGKHYAFLDHKGILQFRTPGGVGVVGPDKPVHRVRKSVPTIESIVEAKVSACTQTMPGYEVDPSQNDQDSRQAAALSEQVAEFGYDKWRIRHNRVKAITNAIVQREGFSLPFFDKNLGARDENGECEGEIRILTFTRDQISWEPDEDFEDSRWHAIERCMRPEEVRAMPGYCGDPLELPDGTAPKRVNVTEYLERPSREYPKGRRCWFADGRVMVDFRDDPECPVDWQDWFEPYPLMDAEDRVIDEPVLHRISYTVNPNGEDMGLVERLIDLQTTQDDCLNKLTEWKNRCLVPQFMARKGSNLPRMTDVPGAVNEYTGDTAPVPVPVPPIPQELFSMYEMSRDEMRSYAADVQIEAQARLSSDTADTARQANDSRWASFLGDVAEYDSRLMRHCLVLVARNYSDERKINIRGQYGWESVQTFTGADLMSQVNVRVGPETLSQNTRAQRQQMVQFLQANWPGAISAEAALGYVEGGAAAGLIESPKRQIARAWRIVKALMSGTPPEALGTRFDPDVPNYAAQPVPGPPDPLTGAPTFTAPMGAEVPNYMPAPWDNIDIWRKVVGDTMCSEAFELKPPQVREAMYEMWRGLDWMEKTRAAQQAQMQTMQAQSLGMNNAAAPQGPPPLPDRAGLSPGSNQSAVPTPA